MPKSEIPVADGGTLKTPKPASCGAGYSMAVNARLCCPRGEVYVVRGKCLTDPEADAGDVPPSDGGCPTGMVDAEGLCRRIAEEGVDAEGCPFYDFTDGTQAIDCLER